jgi:alcohol dehydrogenase class IV
MSLPSRLPLAPFTLQPLPRIEFGIGRFETLAEEIVAIGRRIILVTGGHSLQQGPHWQPLLDHLADCGIELLHHTVTAEPTPEAIDEAVARYRSEGAELVVAIGGGSVLDSGKALAGLLGQPYPVVDYLEGLGVERPWSGPALPWIAVPTTAGTGSEVTWNAVIGRSGERGFKKSFRAPGLLARLAIVDPLLVVGMPPGQLIANAMDAYTQLLESYTSIRATPLTQSLALSGMAGYLDALEQVLAEPDPQVSGDSYSRLAYGSLLSGIVLAHTGLGAVHGLAPILGARYGMPHGAACGALLAAATEVNITALQQRPPACSGAGSYADAGRLISREYGLDDASAEARLIDYLWRQREQLAVGGLASSGVSPESFLSIAEAARGSSSMRTNPLVLTDEELIAILQLSLADGGRVDG